MKKVPEESKSKIQGLSRRAFLKAGIAGAAAVPLLGLKADLFAKSKKRKEDKGHHKPLGLMIDTFCHIMPPKYIEAFSKRSKVRPDVVYTGRFGMASMETMSDVEARLRMIDQHPGYVQIRE